jgi:flavin-binding protein dodecin
LSVEAAFHHAGEDDLWIEVEPPASRRLLAAALDCFACHGYHGTTTRQIADQAGMSPGAVYVHYPSKGELLYRISHVGHVAALAALEDAAVGVEDPMQRITAMVESVAAWHARHHQLARVVQYELEALPVERRHGIMALRSRFAARVQDEIENGVRSGSFGAIDVQGAGLAVLSLCIDIARWYRPTSGRQPQALGTLYADIVRRALRPNAAAARNLFVAQPGEEPMDHVYKSVEVTGTSTAGVDDAVKAAVAKAAETVRNLDWFEVVGVRGHIADRAVGHFQVTVKIGFRLD